MKKRRLIPTFVYILVLVLLFSWVLGLFSPGKERLEYSQIVELFQQEQVKAFELQDDVITMELHGTLDGENISNIPEKRLWSRLS